MAAMQAAARSVRCASANPLRLPAVRPRASCRVHAAMPSDDTAHCVAAALSRRQALLAAAAVPLAGAAQLVASGPAVAGLGSYDVTGQGIEEVNISLGNSLNQFVFEPSTIELTAGRLTKLKFTNPSNVTHYFTALEFADKVYTVLVLAGDPQVEIKGKVQEVALKAGASATWVLMPIKPGTYPLRCPVKGHTEGGMVGTIIVKPPAAAVSS